ncbi:MULTISPECIES: TolC family protein [Croceitalea]|uniref:TolC family protein n=1 Tax=Croceitalea vernalis TaxID=3075599 RepID=A0ABU3BFU3_9FLAO|nr:MULTISPECIES: TolC family protein [unclassified Croceitalea]MDT0539237.1 TolC family protein [Croceitalea sp. P059]MDT0621031.1 TolC family protein [Croceitalea sp. P007]
MKLKITILLVVCATFITNAQMKQWTLEECVLYAVENNLSVKQSELDLENAKIDKSDAIGNILPNFNAQISGSGNTGLSFDPTNNQPTTTTILTSSGNATAAVNLFDGLRNYNRLNRAKMNALASQYRLEDLKDDIRLNVANAYLSVLSNKEALKVSKAQYIVTEQDLNRTKELVESGVLPRGDLLEIEATAATQEQQIVNNEALVLISRVSLAQLLQITDYENFDIANETFDVPPSDILDNSAKVIFDKALTFRNDIKFSEMSVELAKKDVEINKGGYYPTLSAFFNYNTRYSDQFLDPITGDLIGFKDQLWINDGISYGAQLNIPIFNGWSTRNSVKRSQISLKQAELQLEQDKLNLEADIQQAYVNVNTFGKSYEAAGKTLESSRLAYEYSKERYDAGLLNAFDFGQAQARVDNAEATLIRSKYDYIFRIKILEFFYGIPLSLD